MNSVKILVDKYGLSKYSIAKDLEVSWNTVHMWYKDVYEPSLKRKERLHGLLNQTKKEA